MQIEESPITKRDVTDFDDSEVPCMFSPQVKQELATVPTSPQRNYTMYDDFDSDSSDDEIFNHIALKDRKSEVFSGHGHQNMIDISAVEESAR